VCSTRRCAGNITILSAISCLFTTFFTYCGRHDATGGLDNGARVGNARYDPVVEADERESTLGLPQHDREGRGLETKRGVVWGLSYLENSCPLRVSRYLATGISSLPVRLAMCVLRPHGTNEFFFLIADFFLGYQRERGSRAQLDLDGLVRPWHHHQARAGPAVQTAYHD
jgi:hypothetical protein